MSCIYAPSKCLFCESLVKPEELKSHLTTECERLEWAERSSKETKGSVGLLSHIEWYGNAFKLVNVDEIEFSFVVILDDILVMMIKLEQQAWRVLVVSPNPMQLDCYFKQFGSTIYETQTILTLN